MSTVNIFYSYLMYLIHPFKTHDFLRGKDSGEDLGLMRLSLYESLGTSWVFIVFNGLIRILLINFVLILFYQFTSANDGLLSQLVQSENTTGFYFLILSTILDVIFYPVLTLIVVHFWEFIMRGYARVLGQEGDIETQARDVLTVSLSSNILMVIPIIGDLAQKIVSIFLIFVGLKKQFGMSGSLIICILMTPFVMLMGFFSLIMLFIIVSL